MSRSGNFDLFIFDEGGVMIRNFYVIPAMAKLMGFGEKELIALLKPELGAYSRGRLSGEEFWRNFTARTNIVVREDYFASLFRPEADEQSFSIVRDLARTTRTVCGTNTIDSHHETNTRLGMYDGFHAVYASHIIGQAKPDTEFWTEILSVENVPPERTFFVDDTEANIDAARKLGIKAWLFRGAEDLRGHLESIGELD